MIPEGIGRGFRDAVTLGRRLEHLTRPVRLLSTGGFDFRKRQIRSPFPSNT